MQTIGLETLGEVYLFVAQFDRTCRYRVSDMDDLANYFDCSSLDIIAYIPDLKSLERKGLLVRRRSRESNILRQYFAVSDEIIAAVENKPIGIAAKNDLKKMSILILASNLQKKF